jgi:hypothetical protein
MALSRRWVLMFLLGMAPLTLQAQETADETTMTFQVKQSCNAKGVCEDVVLGDGMIVETSMNDFRDFMEANSSLSTVYLHSPGGHLLTGMRLGLMIRLMGMDTAMTSKMSCMSACAYTFMGGVERSMEAGAIIGVHRFYVEDGSATEEDGQMMLSEMNRFVVSMGVSTEVLSLAARAGRHQYVAIDADRAIGLNLDNHTFAVSSWQVSPSDDGLSTMSARGQSFGSDRMVVVNVGRSGKRALVNVSIHDPAFNSKYRWEEEQKKPRLLFCRHTSDGKMDEKRCVEGQPTGSWRHDRENRYSLSFSLPVKDFKRLTDGATEDGLAVAVFGGNDGR